MAVCHQPGSAGPGALGACTLEPGTLAYFEIKQLGLTPTIDNALMAAWSRYGNGDWIGYDTPETIKMKMCYASSMGLQGAFFWDAEQDGADYALIKAAKAQLNTLGLFSCSTWRMPTCPSVRPASYVCPRVPSTSTGGASDISSSGEVGGATTGGATGRCTYIIKLGDTLWAIAQAYKTEVATLTSLNPGANAATLLAGQVRAAACAQRSNAFVCTAMQRPSVSLASMLPSSFLTGVEHPVLKLRA